MHVLVRKPHHIRADTLPWGREPGWHNAARNLRRLG
jgi:hypothetical protein